MLTQYTGGTSGDLCGSCTGEGPSKESFGGVEVVLIDTEAAVQLEERETVYFPDTLLNYRLGGDGNYGVAN